MRESSWPPKALEGSFGGWKTAVGEGQTDMPCRKNLGIESI